MSTLAATATAGSSPGSHDDFKATELLQRPESSSSKRLSLDNMLPSHNTPKTHKAWLPKVPQPPNTIAYKVQAEDTIIKVAVMFDMAPEEVAQLNRIKNIYPGQTVWVKDPTFEGPLEIPQTTSKRRPSSIDVTPLELVDTGLAMGPVSPTDEFVRQVSRSAFFTGPDEATYINVTEDELLGPEQTIEFINETMARVRVRLVTNAQGVIPGVLEITCDYVKFLPDPTAVVLELGAERFTLYLDAADLLPPRSQEEAPTFPHGIRTIMPESGPHHKENVPQASLPAYLELRVRLIFGQKPKPSTIQSYWFAIPHDKMDTLFARVWAVCGIEDPGFDECEPSQKQASPPASTPDWMPRVQSFEHYPELAGESRILNSMILQKLSRYLPAIRRCGTMCLLYSTYEHGMSISSLYRSFKGYKGASVMVIKDIGGAAFGAYAPQPWHVSETFYGSGESFLFKCEPNFKAFPWSRKNQFFMMGKTDSIMMGGGDGSFGLFLDDTFLHGSSKRCGTFNNEPLCENGDNFTVHGLEVWGFEADWDDF